MSTDIDTRLRSAVPTLTQLDCAIRDIEEGASYPIDEVDALLLSALSIARRAIVTREYYAVVWNDGKFLTVEQAVAFDRIVKGP